MTLAQTAGLSMPYWFVGMPVLFELAQRDRQDTLARDPGSFGKSIGAGEAFVLALRGRVRSLAMTSRTMVGRLLFHYDPWPPRPNRRRIAST